MSIFSAIGHFFEGLFNEAKKAYDKLSPEQKLALQQGSGLVAIINNNLNAAPAAIRAAIQKAFPTVDEAKLEATLFEVAKSFGITQATNLDEAIAAIQKHLGSLKGKAWEIASHAAASLAAAWFSPETRTGVIVSLMEYVFQFIIKKKVSQPV